MPEIATVVRDLPVFQEVGGHHAPVPFFVTAAMFGELGFEVAGGEISDKVDTPVADPHTHDIPEIYLLLAPEPGGAVIDVLADGEHHELSAPAAMFIPAGTVHRFVTKKAMPGSYCLGLLMTGMRKHR
jgi:hypothetical protein